MRLPTTEQIAEMTDERLLAHLGRIADRLDIVNAEQNELWAARIAIYQEGRRRDPAITHGRLADAARVSEVAIITKLRQLDERAQAATG